MEDRTTDIPRRLRVLHLGNGGGKGLLEASSDDLRLEIEEADSESAALERLRRGRYHAVVVEGEPDAQAVADFLERLCEEQPDVPVVLVGGDGSTEAIRRALSAGAGDCLPPTTPPPALGRALLRAVQHHRTVIELRAALARAESVEVRFQSIVEENADGIVIVSPDGVVQFVNPAAEQLFQRFAEDLVGEPFGFPLVSGEPAELDLVRRDGTTLVAELRVVEIPWEEGWAHLISLRDITDRRSAEEQARQLVRAEEARSQAEQAKRFYRFLADAGEILESSLEYAETLRRLAALVVPRLADWCVIDILEDGTAARRMGATAEDPRLADLMRELERRYALEPDSAQPAAIVLRTGEPLLVDQVDEAWLREHVRDERHAEILRGLGLHSLLAVPLLARHAPVGVMTLVCARPGRPFRERDLNLAVELGRRAGTAVDNARLYRDVQLANRAKTDFLAVMSHELRTPLNAIIGYVDIVRSGISGPLNEAQQEHLRRVKVSSKHLLQLIEEILSFARMESGRDALQTEEVLLAELAAEVANLAEPLAHDRKLGFHLDVSDGERRLRTDPGKVRQVLLNLLTNAVKFTDEGEVRLEARIEGEQAVFVVADTGCGIEADNLERIFEPFWQVERPRTRRAGGTGLGLSVARKLLEMLGGDVSVESVPGDGSTFTVRIPVHLAGPGNGEGSSAAADTATAAEPEDPDAS
ncbi:MAG TPA: ATP-binding protein [Longimicrobiales bacterium]|nr:ATP-binding protein [Longimicrobiales bacterium]